METEHPKLKKILLVEDDDRCTGLYIEFLSEENHYDIKTAKSAEDAKEILEKENYDFKLCLVDQNLPGIKGDELLKWVKSKAPQIAVVVATGGRDENFVYNCLQNGAIDYIQKPVDSKNFCKTIGNSIERQAKINETPGEIKAAVQTQGWVELTAPSEMEYLARMQKFTNILLQTSLPQETSEDLRLIIEEIGRNAIEWGNKFNREKEFKISYCIFKNSIVLKFEDEGEGFHPENIPNPTLDPKAHIKRRKDEGKRPGGFGVYMVQRMMDDVIYSDKGNTVVMTKYF